MILFLVCNRFVCVGSYSCVGSYFIYVMPFSIELGLGVFIPARVFQHSCLCAVTS